MSFEPRSNPFQVQFEPLSSRFSSRRRLAFEFLGARFEHVSSIFFELQSSYFRARFEFFRLFFFLNLALAILSRLQIFFSSRCRVAYESFGVRFEYFFELLSSPFESFFSNRVLAMRSAFRVPFDAVSMFCRAFSRFFSSIFDSISSSDSTRNRLESN